MLRALCTALRITADELFDRGELVGKTPQHEADEGLAGLRPLQAVPRIDWHDAPRWATATEVERAAMGASYAPILVPMTSRRCFALEVRDTTMEPLFPPGSIIVVDTERVPTPGDYVIATLGPNTPPTFKQYIVDAGRGWLRPLNPQFPATMLTEQSTIIGVVARLVREF